MKTRLIAVSAVGLALAGAGRSDDAAEVRAALKRLNDAYAADSAAGVRALMTADHVAVTPYAGRQTLDELVKGLPDQKLTEYAPGPMDVKPLGDGSALVTYLLAQKGTYKGKPMPAKAWAAAVWVKRDGKWKEAYYQETPAE